jgi:YD repeat-containing protein
MNFPQGGKAVLRDRIGAAFEALTGTPSAFELEDGPLYRPSGRERVLAGLGAISSRLENPAGLAVLEREVVGAGRRLKTFRGGVAALLLLGMPVTLRGQEPIGGPAPTPGPGLGGYLTYDVTAHMDAYKNRFENYTHFTLDSTNKYLQYLNAFLIQYKNYKLARQMYNRVASGQIDLVLLPAIPTIKFDMPVSDKAGQSGLLGNNGVKYGEWTSTTIHFMPGNKQNDDAVFEALPRFAPKVNLGGMLTNAVKNLVGDADVIAQKYDADGHLVSLTDAASQQRHDLAGTLTEWMFGANKSGVLKMLQDPDGFLQDRTDDREKNEDASIQGLYQVLMYQKAQDDAAVPYMGPSYTYLELQRTYVAMLARRRSLSDPDGLYQAQLQEAAAALAQTKRDVEYASGQRGTLSAVVQASAENAKKQADAAKNYGSKSTDTNSTTTIADAAKTSTAVLAGGEMVTPNNVMEFLAKAAASGNTTNEILAQISAAIVGKNIRDEDAKREEEIAQQRALSNRIRTEGWVLKDSVDALGAATKLRLVFPQVLADSPGQGVIYARDENGNMVALPVEKPVETKILEIDPTTPQARQFLDTAWQQRVNACTNYSMQSAEDTGKDMANAMTNSAGMFGGDFLSQLYRVVMAGFKSIFGLRTFDLNADAAAIKRGNIIYKNFNIGYNWQQKKG